MKRDKPFCVGVPEVLLARVKATCSYHGWTLKDFVAEALQALLDRAAEEGMYVAPGASVPRTGTGR